MYIDIFLLSNLTKNYFPLSNLRMLRTCHHQEEKIPILWLLGHESKHKGHFLFSNFKSLKKQNVISFLIYGPWANIGMSSFEVKEVEDMPS